MKDRDDELREEIEGAPRRWRSPIASRAARTRAKPRRRARRELGNLSQIQEATRDVWGRRWLEQAAQDVRYALRIFRRNPGFALVAILSLALGIGANTALFEVVNAVRLRTLPVADPARLVEIRLADTEGARGNFETWHPAVTQPIWREIAGAARGVLRAVRVGRDGVQSVGRWRGAHAPTASGSAASSSTTLGLTPGRGPPALAGRRSSRLRAARRARPRLLAARVRRRPVGHRPDDHARLAARGDRRRRAGRRFTVSRSAATFDVALPLCAEPAFSGDGKGRVDAGTTWWLSVFGRLEAGLDGRARVGAPGRRSRRQSSAPRCPPTYPAGQRREVPGLQARRVSGRRGAVAAARGLRDRRCGCCSPSPALVLRDRLRESRQPAARARDARASARSRCGSASARRAGASSGSC